MEEDGPGAQRPPGHAQPQSKDHPVQPQVPGWVDSARVCCIPPCAAILSQGQKGAQSHTANASWCWDHSLDPRAACPAQHVHPPHLPHQAHLRQPEVSAQGVGSSLHTACCRGQQSLIQPASPRSAVPLPAERTPTHRWLLIPQRSSSGPTDKDSKGCGGWPQGLWASRKASWRR